MSSQDNYKTDNFLSASGPISDNSAGLDLYSEELDIQKGTFRLTAVPRLSGSLGENTGNGAFLQAPMAFSFDVYQGNTLVNPGAGNLMSAQNLILRLNGSPMNYPFEKYSANFYSSVGVDNYNSDPAPLYIRDKTKSLAGFAVQSNYLSFIDGKPNKEAILMDIKQGSGLLEWKFTRSGSTKLAVFLFGALMLIGAAASSLMTINVVKGKRPPSINTLTWLAAFLFALFQVRNQLPGNPPSGVKFDMYIFFPTILILICLILVNVSAWNSREDWDMENPLKAIKGKRVSSE